MLAWRADGPAEAPPLVLLNSIGTTGDTWTPCVGPLAEQFRVIRIETRGHGDSAPAAPDAPRALSDLGADVLATLDGIGVGRAHLAGISLGGMIAMWLAAHRPERVARLALVCTSPHRPP